MIFFPRAAGRLRPAVLLALLVLALVAARARRAAARARGRRAARTARRAARATQRAPTPVAYDPGRERRAEQRARELLRSCVNDEEWAMYRDLGFIRVAGRRLPVGRIASDAEPAYAYLIYPHKPIVAYVPADRPPAERVLRRVPRPDAARPRTRLPDSDDVLAKWMALTGDEAR